MIDYLGILFISYQILILVYFVVLNSIYTYITVDAYLQISKTMEANEEENALAETMYFSNARPVSVICPAYNEEVAVITTINSLINVKYPEFEIIVVNDGSSDRTLELLLDTYKAEKIDRPVKRVFEHEEIRGAYLSTLYPNLWIIDKENGGKSDALNVGIEFSSYPLVCSIDADSILESDALLRLGQHFLNDKELIAVGGSVRVLNGCVVKDSKVVETRAPYKIIECIQIAEYMRGFMAGRLAWGRLDALLIISGAFGIFRKDLLIEIGGYRKTVGEDMDLVIRLHRHCVDKKINYRVDFLAEPVCWTQVPSDLSSLLQQRNRWQRGLGDALWHSRGMLFNPNYGAIGMVAFPYYVVVELIGPIVELSGYLGFIYLYLKGYISPHFAMLFFIIAVTWGMWLNAAAVLLDNLVIHRYKKVSDALKIALLGSLEFLGYRQIVVVERLFGTFQSWRSNHWGKIKRKDLSVE